MRKMSSAHTFTSGKTPSGFTLVEALVVIVIMAVLAGIAIPGFARWLPDYRLRGAARDLYSNLQFAKSGAIRDRADWSVEFPGGNTYRIVNGGGVVKTVNLQEYKSGVAFGAGGASSAIGGGAITPVPPDPIVFNSRGFTNDEIPAFAYLTNNRNTSYAVGTWASGAVILRKWMGSDWQ